MVTQHSEDWRKQRFDFIFTGAGCAALSLLMRMIKSGRFSHNRILLIEKDRKMTNDRTWCFWEKESGFFEEIVYKQWNSLDFFGKGGPVYLTIKPYVYKMIRGIDFYNYCFNEIRKQSNIVIIQGQVGEVLSDNENITIEIDDELWDGGKAIVFNSIYRVPQNKDGLIYLLQHFTGWIIQSDRVSFDPHKGTLMDFRISQQPGTGFIYALPLSENRALVEYTLFTETLLDKQQYHLGLRSYLHDFLKIDSYEIQEEEFGIIPMTNQVFDFYKNGVYNIGTAGGQTKASTGYSFQFIQKQSQRIIDCLMENRSLQSLQPLPKRFKFYDTIFLRMLAEGKLSGVDIFTRLFARNKTSSIFRFLDNETSLAEELRIIASLPTIPFLKAAVAKGIRNEK